MTFRSGKLDRKIVIEQNTPSGDTFGGGQTDSWSTFATVWAEVIPMSATERFMSQQRYASRVSMFNIRYVSGLNSKMRIQYESKAWRILGIKEISRLRGWEVLAEQIE